MAEKKAVQMKVYLFILTQNEELTDDGEDGEEETGDDGDDDEEEEDAEEEEEEGLTSENDRAEEDQEEEEEASPAVATPSQDPGVSKDNRRGKFLTSRTHVKSLE